MIGILEAYRKGTDYNIKMREDGLLSGGSSENALTWMDATVDGKPVTPRTGLAVEVNALWYNAICYALEVAGPRSAEGKRFIKAWKHWPEKIEKAFMKTFWDEKKGYLADYVNGEEKDWSVRPNQILALSLPHSPVKDEAVREAVLETVQQELLTPRGCAVFLQKIHNIKEFFRQPGREKQLISPGVGVALAAGAFCRSLCQFAWPQCPAICKIIVCRV